MGYEARISTKGQLVVPKDLRDRQDWKPGDRVEFVERFGVVELRAIPDERSSPPTAEEVFARIRARNTYRGPRVSDEEMKAAVREIAVKRYERSLP
jgi:AbrB family looped-hinge helix DNA binding protein